MISLRLSLVLMAVSTVGGCSDDYSVRAIPREGSVAFVRDEPLLGEPECIDRIEVRADNGRPKTKPEPGDDDTLVLLRGSYWSAAPDEQDCRKRFPIVYGEKLGTRLPDNFPFVAAKTLKAGVVYEVWTPNRRSGSGMGWFKLLPDGGIVNYPEDPTPAVLDEAGWQVAGGSQRKD